MNKAYLFWRNFKGHGFLKINSYKCHSIQKNIDIKYQRKIFSPTSCREKNIRNSRPIKPLEKLLFLFLYLSYFYVLQNSFKTNRPYKVQDHTL